MVQNRKKKRLNKKTERIKTVLRRKGIKMYKKKFQKK